MALDIFALIVLAVIIAVVIWLVTLLGPLPGKIAEQRNHPQADAIRVLGWIGLITMGIGWLAALVWAYMRPVGQAAANAQMEARVTALEQKIRQLAEGGTES